MRAGMRRPEARGVSLSELVRLGLNRVRAVRHRHQPRSVDPRSPARAGADWEQPQPARPLGQPRETGGRCGGGGRATDRAGPGVVGAAPGARAPAGQGRAVLIKFMGGRGGGGAIAVVPGRPRAGGAARRRRRRWCGATSSGRAS